MISKLKKLIVILLNPISPIMTLVVGWLLSIVVTDADEKFPEFINVLIEYPYIIVVFTVFWLIFSVIYTEKDNEIESYKKELELKEEVIRQKDSQLTHTAGVIVHRAGNFAQFNKLLRFNDALQGFVDNNPLVESAQIYNYSIKRIQDRIYIKVCYETGYTYEDIDINNIAQTYYVIDYKDYNTIRDIINTWKKLARNDVRNNREKDALIGCCVKEITEIFKKYRLDLLAINNLSEVEQMHFTKYRILTLLLRLTRRSTTTTFDKNNILGDAKADIEKYLLNGKRTGILNSILLEDVFMFKYTRNSFEKNGRAYVSFHINITNQNYVVVFSLQSDDLDSYTNLEHEITNLKEDFVKRISKK